MLKHRRVKPTATVGDTPRALRPVCRVAPLLNVHWRRISADEIGVVHAERDVHWFRYRNSDSPFVWDADYNRATDAEQGA